MAIRKQYALIALAAFVAFAAPMCNIKVPIKEMITAKQAIAQAAKVKADKYAPEEFGAARNKLMESHDEVVKKNVDKAKDAAIEAARLAGIAYEKALPLLAKDTIAVAEKSMDEAREAYAERLAVEEYHKADGELKAANDNFQNKKYLEAYQSALDADRDAKNARNAALGKKDVLKDAIAEVRMTLAEADRYGARETAPEKCRLAEENIQLAQAGYDSIELKKGFSAVEAAKMNADDALVASLEKRAREKAATAEKLVDRAGAAKLADDRQDDLRAARESLQSAKSTLAESKYKESIAASDEAIRLAAKALGISLADASNLAAKDGSTVIDKGADKGTDKGTGKDLALEDADYWYYTVKFRQKYTDCLWYISWKYYKNPRHWKRIHDANRDQVRNPDLILPGWRLKVPKVKK